MSQLGPAAETTAVVVVNYGSSAMVADNLAELSTPQDAARIVVVDNYSTAGERRALVELGALRGWDVVTSSGNPGFGTGMNLGVERAKELGCAVFVLLNPDARISVQTLRSLSDLARAEPMTLVAPGMSHPDGRPGFAGACVLLERGRTGRPAPNEKGEVIPWLSGACLAIHRQLWDALGGFDDDYFLYWEDVDLSYRCLEAGGRLSLRPELTAVHSVGGTQGGRRSKSATYYYYNCRNRLLFAAKHLPPRLILRWLAYTPAYGRAVVLRGGRRQLLNPVVPLSSALRGSASGVGLAVRALIRKAHTT